MKKMCRLFSILMIIALMSVSFTGCKSEPVKQEEKENVIDDNYRNYYHIFVYSFADGNGDGMTKKELLSKPYTERQRIYQENPDLFNEIMNSEN